MTTATKPKAFGKAEALARWESLDSQQPIRLTPINTDHKGSSYDQDSIRITGNQEFIESILAKLKGLLEYDGNGSRLSILWVETMTRVKDETGKLVTGELTGSWACYVKAISRNSTGPRKPRGPDKQPRTRQPKDQSFARTKRKPAPVLAKPQAKVTAPEPAQEPLYAIGVKVEPNEDCPQGWSWTEPACDIDSGLPMDTYFDVSSCDSAIVMLKKNKTLSKENLQIVEINRSNGTFECVEV